MGRALSLSNHQKMGFNNIDRPNLTGGVYFDDNPVSLALSESGQFPNDKQFLKLG
jgi:hypothetical protein